MSASSDYTEYVEAVQDYDYKNDKGESISITKGNYYVLLERTNEEWWHIQDVAKSNGKDFYVPANFVQSLGRYPEELDEVFDETGKHREEFYSDESEEGESESEDELPTKIVVPKGKPLPQIPTKARPKPVSGVSPKSANRISSFGKPLSSTPPPDYLDEDTDLSKHTPNTGKNDSNSPNQNIVCIEIDESPTVRLPKSEEASPSPKRSINPGKVLPPPDPGLPPLHTLKSPPHEADPPRSTPVVYANLTDLQNKPASQVQAETEYANLDVIQSVLKPPSVPNAKDLIKVLSENWELYNDPETNRNFYFNSVTKETSWKPPRGIDLKHIDGELDTSGHVHETEGHSSVTHGYQGSIPKGYRSEVTEEGGKIYINEVTKEKWIACVDASGKPYFYSETNQQSLWQLPELFSHSQSVSDTLSHVDVASRTAALRERLTKTASMYVDNHDRLDFNRKSTTLPPNLMLGQNNNLSHNDDVPLAGNISPVAKTFPKVTRSSSRRHGSLWDRPNVRCNKDKVDSLEDPLCHDHKDRNLNKAKVMENGKKIRKKTWSSSYVLLSGSNLVFYKDQKSSQMRPGSPHGKPELVINLHGANIEFGSKDLSSKKNVILLTLARSSEDATQYLLQADDSTRIHHWYITLTETVDRMRKGLDLPADINGSNGSPVKQQQQPSTEPEKLKRGKSTKGKSSPSAGLQRSVSTEEAASQERKRRIRDILFNFISRRPSPEVLKEKGIIKEAIFGCELKHLCEKEGSLVPMFIKKVIAAIEAQGLDHDGMYRVNGNTSQIQKLRCMVDQVTDYDLNKPDEWDIHVLTGALKLFFRELKEPLFPFDSYTGFEKAIMLPSSSEKKKAFKERISHLPKCNYETMKYLFKHLQKVTLQSKENRMQSHNLAIVFGPTLLWPQLRSSNLAYSLVFQNRIIEFILLEYDRLYE